MLFFMRFTKERILMKFLCYRHLIFLYDSIYSAKINETKCSLNIYGGRSPAITTPIYLDALSKRIPILVFDLCDLLLLYFV
jgi:hypothetical protein